MARLYKYKDDRLDQFLSNEMLIRVELEKYDITFNRMEFFNISAFVTETISLYDFLNYRLDETCSPLIKNVYTTYEVDTGMMLIEGEGRFYFEHEEELLKLDVFPGDFVVIPKNLAFCFKASEPISTITFFGE
jgi:cupin superfamily acireductone dioxygenase involved in methionine salvage